MPVVVSCSEITLTINMKKEVAERSTKQLTKDMQLYVETDRKN